MKKYYMCGVTFQYELGYTDCTGLMNEDLEEYKRVTLVGMSVAL